MFTLAAGSVIGLLVYQNRRHKKGMMHLLESRTPRDDNEFARYFCKAISAKDSGIGQVAVRVRAVLADNLGQPLDGLNFDDHLDGGLGTELLANPDLMIALGEEFNFPSPTADYVAYEKLTNTLETFGDLVVYVDQSMKQDRQTGADAAEGN